ncbi:DUF1992 domain-containing protein [Nakamurella flava]|uniref:DUF1992 domain-containing protein n=1 Tax=Nakamurella flava TaxID=2576308 RepID=A0A4U6QKL8_9ACTN|nr:DUF1992 domain-containing protein [Nakamurella flava]TKV60829.1 DUF1992 domain-containing protein [Nakamurella flava]
MHGGDPAPEASGPVARPRRPGRAEQQIRDAIARGEFDDLPGAGKPLPAELLSRDEHWWIRQFAEREQTPGSAFLPAALQIRKEVQTLAERVAVMTTEASVRRTVLDLNARIRAEILLPTSSIVLGVGEQDEQDVVDGWHRAVAARRAATVREAADRAAAVPAPRRGWRRWLWGPGQG